MHGVAVDSYCEQYSHIATIIGYILECFFNKFANTWTGVNLKILVNCEVILVFYLPGENVSSLNFGCEIIQPTPGHT